VTVVQGAGGGCFCPRETETLNDLHNSAQYLKGVGPQRYRLLERMGLDTIRDVLLHIPRGYQDFRAVVPIGSVQDGLAQTVRGKVVEVRSRPARRGPPMVEVNLGDESGWLDLVWFNQPYQQERFAIDQSVLASGKVRRYGSRMQIVNPICQLLDEDDEEGEGASGRLLPVYSLTEGLRVYQMRRIIGHALEAHADQMPELFDEAFRAERDLVGIAQALRWIHNPADDDQVTSAKRRLVYEEFFLLELALALRRRDLTGRRKAPALPVTERLDTRIRKLFPFQFTPGQEKVIGEIVADLAQTIPMNRLLQGDVGSGKTAVALYALLTAVANQHQAALMAPTEVLARQHWQRVQGYLEHSKVRRCLLVGGLSAKERAETLAAIAAGEVDLVIGTQAIIQKDVAFKQLGVIVVDEQHKFGVRQRAAFRGLGIDPHYLVMTATPIPRTLMLTVFGDLDTSTIEDLPPGRQPVQTILVSPAKQAKAFRTVADHLRAGRQAYVVYPLVEESDHLDLKAAEQMASHLAGAVFPDFRVGLVHGRMDAEGKESVMADFRAGRIHVLVSTLVVEVGIDVPNATVMVVEHADRFGLAQLHQLRGRIGRGEHRGTCFLMAERREKVSGTFCAKHPPGPAGQKVPDTFSRRLRILAQTANGFRIAEEDLRIRGPGQFFGTRQHGLPELRIGNLIDDYDLLKLTRHDAFAIVADDPDLTAAPHAAMRREVLAKYAGVLDLGHVG